MWSHLHVLKGSEMEFREMSTRTKVEYQLANALLLDNHVA